VQPTAHTHTLRAHLAASLRGLAFRLDNSLQMR
jgi:hypothetical protein